MRQLLQRDWWSLKRAGVWWLILYESFRVEAFVSEQSEPRWIILDAHQRILLFQDFYDWGTGDIQWFQSVQFKHQFCGICIFIAD